ncbi:S8 family serine peptidase [Hyalangium rubrum]|uniref:S8 family serine peptidase n=1 Tax=Hyalangium rubrum TaxID=3103134 RepID=A0ABU5HFU6_9BACT|nr:S8 family serine peptidase [Hyalangium sp. s54d21]MDY7230935.1 S8 family serine peptidase [Hyalangium sp. s54d21]
MKKLIVNLAALNLIACGGAQFEGEEEQVQEFDVTQLALKADANGKIPGYYVVRMKEGVDAATVAKGHGVSTNFIYKSALKGFAGPLTEAQVRKLQQDEMVASVELDGLVEVNAQTIPYGISNIGATTNSTLAGNGSGAVTGATVFVIDTGIASHADLNLVGHVNYAGGKNTDCHGHGTHVAGTVGAKDDANYVVGVAPGIPVFGVKVLNCQGSGTNSGVIAGMDYVAASTVARKVANMSLGGGFAQDVNNAAANMVNNNVAVAVAAGNDGANASTKSPASEPSVLTVAAHDSNNVNASWSNFGTVVDLSAPGVSVLSLSRTGGTATMSGTSMASPHVAGALALYRAQNQSATGAQAMSAVKANTSGTSSGGFGRLYVGNW